MSVYIVRRALQSIAVMLLMATLVFIGVYMIGDPAQLLTSTACGGYWGWINLCGASS
jgi:ABC-type dipeptide/oligopeptide/nickel transport system permease component